MSRKSADLYKQTTHARLQYSAVCSKLPATFISHSYTFPRNPELHHSTTYFPARTRDSTLVYDEVYRRRFGHFAARLGRSRVLPAAAYTASAAQTLSLARGVSDRVLARLFRGSYLYIQELTCTEPLPARREGKKARLNELKFWAMHEAHSRGGARRPV